MLWAQIIQKILKRVGGLGSDIADAQSIYNKADKAHQADLERRQEMGALGLTDEELDRANEASVAPVQAQLRELNLRNQLGTEVQDVGSGSAARTAMASQDDQTRKLVQAGYAIEQANEAARSAQEQELLDLKRAKELKNAAIWKAVFKNLVASGDDTNDVGNILGQNKADSEGLGTITSSGSSGFGADSGTASGIMSSFGGGGF